MSDTITTEVIIEDLGFIEPGDVLLHSNPDGTWTARREVPEPEHEGPKVATLVKRNLGASTGTAHLYKVDPPMKSYSWGDEPVERFEYVRVSAVNVPFSGPETYIFGADSEGNVLNWGELDGSYRGGLDHEEALRGAGYEVTA